MLKMIFKFLDMENILRNQYEKLKGLFHKDNTKEKRPSFYRMTYSMSINPEKRDPKLIVPLTLYLARINFIHFALNTFLNQTLKPDMVILWLADSQFPYKEKDFPREILRLHKFGISIEWCADLKS